MMTINKKNVSVGIAVILSILLLSAPIALAADTSGSTGTVTAAPADTGTTATTATATTTTGTGTSGTDTAGTTTTVTPADPGTGTAAGPDSGNTAADLPPVLDDNGQTVNPGTLPDSPFYWLSNLIKKIQLVLTFDPAKKASLTQEQALQDLAAATKMVEQGKAEAAQKAMDNYTEKVTAAQDFLAKVSDQSSDSAQKLQAALAKTNAANIETLGELLDKLPPQAAQKVALNVVRSMEKLVTKMDDQDKEKINKQIKITSAHLKDEQVNQETATALTQLQGLLESGDSEQSAANENNPGTAPAVSNDKVQVMNQEQNKNELQKQKQEQDKNDKDKLKEQGKTQERDKNELKEQEQKQSSNELKEQEKEKEQNKDGLKEQKKEQDKDGLKEKEQEQEQKQEQESELKEQQKESDLKQQGQNRPGNGTQSNQGNKDNSNRDNEGQGRGGHER